MPVSVSWLAVGSVMVEPGVALTELLTPDAKVPPYAIYLTVTVEAAGVAVALLSLLVVEAMAATGAAVASVVAEGALPVVVPVEAELPSELSVAAAPLVPLLVSVAVGLAESVVLVVLVVSPVALVSAVSCVEATVVVLSAVDESAMAPVGIIDATSVRATALESMGERRQSFRVTVESTRMCCGS